MGKVLGYVLFGVIVGILVYLYQVMPDYRGVLVFAAIAGSIVGRR